MPTPSRAVEFCTWGSRFICLVVLNVASSTVFAQQTAQPLAPLDAAAIIEQLVAHNQERAHQIGAYTSRRHYHISYRGFPHSADADMVVIVTCNGPASKKFEVVSESGSHFIVEHVLERLLKTEQDNAANPRATALTPANYSFTLMGIDTVEGKRAYRLQVEPREGGELLYRGTIWVDAQDFAVVQVQATPAKNPSFWIRDTEIHHVYEKTGEFWMPAHNRSESKVRLGGTAVLTIDYGDYRFASPEAGAGSHKDQVAAAP